MWEPQPLTTLRASKACRGENFTFISQTFSLPHISPQEKHPAVIGLHQPIYDNISQYTNEDTMDRVCSTNGAEEECI
jgi:hypothetical protein